MAHATAEAGRKGGAADDIVVNTITEAAMRQVKKIPFPKIKSVPDQIRSTRMGKTASTEQEKAKDRTIGHGIGSAASNFVTGYALSPLFNQKPRPVGRSFLGHHYGGRALLHGSAMAGAGFVGGAIKENIQAGYEAHAAKKRKKEAAGFLKEAAGLMLYTRSPSERPSAPPPKPAKGFAATFGNSMSASHSHFRHANKKSDEWMESNGEFIDLGGRPGLIRAATEVLKVAPGKAIPRSQALRMVREAEKHRHEAVTRRRMAKMKGMEDGADSAEDVREVLRAIASATKHPRVRYIELVEEK